MKELETNDGPEFEETNWEELKVKRVSDKYLKPSQN
jgi:hypothetical protein